MSVIQKLQSKCISKDTNLQDLLREGLLISSKLRLKDFNQWINCELNGYKMIDDTPEYRKVSHSLSFFNPCRGWIPGNIPEGWDELSESQVTQAIGQLEDLVQNYNDEQGISINLSPERIAVLQKLYDTEFRPRFSVSKTQIVGIIDKVKTLLLEWTLKLEEEGILGTDDLIFTEKEKEAAKEIHIENFNGGVLGNVGTAGIISSGDNAQNTYIENNIESKMNELIGIIKSLNQVNNNSIILELEESKKDKIKMTKALGTVVSKFSDVASITSLAISILSLL